MVLDPPGAVLDPLNPNGGSSHPANDTGRDFGPPNEDFGPPNDDLLLQRATTLYEERFGNLFQTRLMKKENMAKIMAELEDPG